MGGALGLGGDRPGIRGTAPRSRGPALHEDNTESEAESKTLRVVPAVKKHRALPGVDVRIYITFCQFALILPSSDSISNF